MTLGWFPLGFVENKALWIFIWYSAKNRHLCQLAFLPRTSYDLNCPIGSVTSAIRFLGHRYGQSAATLNSTVSRARWKWKYAPHIRWKTSLKETMNYSHIYHKSKSSAQTGKRGVTTRRRPAKYTGNTCLSVQNQRTVRGYCYTHVNDQFTTKLIIILRASLQLTKIAQKMGPP